MATRETGKQRALRIPTDYFKHGDWLGRGKNMLAIIALLIPLAWVAGNYFRGETAYSPGAIAKVHAAWEENCMACHVPFTPIRGPGWTAPILGHSKDSSERCQTCHAGPPHHAGQTPDLACAACHHDHQGRMASLVQLPDGYCTQCHANLTEHGRQATSDIHISINQFASDHPEFRAVKKKDPGRLRFSHARHMRTGLTMSGDPQATDTFRLGRIEISQRKRYERAQAPDNKPLPDDTPVQLNCASCHQLDIGDFGLADAGLSPDLRSAMDAGASMRPITYENQCQACHPLTVKGKDGKETAIPHRLQPEQVRHFLWGAPAHGQVELRPWQPAAGRPLPGKPIASADGKARDGKPEVIAGQIAKEIDDTLQNKVEQFLYKEKLKDAEKLVFWGRQTCGECHYYDSPAGGLPRSIIAPQIPNVWFEHARFNHAAHHAIDCRACHERAYADSPQASGEADDVLIPGIANCVQCHSPRSGSTGGVAYGCTECHSYHHRGDQSVTTPRVQGAGAAARTPATRFHSIDDFLRANRDTGKHR